MGITGLLPLVKKAIKNVNISVYRNKRVCVDAMSWVHAIASNCAHEIYNKVPTEKHLNMLRNKLNILLSHGITPIFIFDGDKAESKAHTTTIRREKREKAEKDLKKAIKDKDTFRARELIKRAVKITGEFIYELMLELQNQGIEYMVAPYEADSQMAYLTKIGYADAIITEDSDLILYGSKCILFKYNGTRADEYLAERLPKAMGKNFSENILDICILSGCDYLPSIRGVGLMTAVKEFEKSSDLGTVIDSIGTKKEIPENYREDFERAKKSFLHHIVYNPHSKQRENFTESEEDLSFLGSLENLKYIVNFDDGVTLELDRHFCPEIEVVPIEKEDIGKENGEKLMKGKEAENVNSSRINWNSVYTETEDIDIVETDQRK